MRHNFFFQFLKYNSTVPKHIPVYYSLNDSYFFVINSGVNRETSDIELKLEHVWE